MKIWRCFSGQLSRLRLGTCSRWTRVAGLDTMFLCSFCSNHTEDGSLPFQHSAIASSSGGSGWLRRHAESQRPPEELSPERLWARAVALFEGLESRESSGSSHQLGELSKQGEDGDDMRWIARRPLLPLRE